MSEIQDRTALSFRHPVPSGCFPDSKFFLQEDFDAVGELAHFSELPHFASDITLNVMPSRRNGRVTVPFSDPESHVWYYLVCFEQNKGVVSSLLQHSSVDTGSQ